MLFALLAFGRNDRGCEPKPPRTFDSAGIRLVGNNDSNPRVRNFSRAYIFRDRFKVRTASREKNAEVFHGRAFRRQPSAISFWTRYDNSPHTLVMHRPRHVVILSATKHLRSSLQRPSICWKLSEKCSKCRT